MIVRQSIAPGERVKPGTRVAATVPTGVIVPLLLRVPVDAASQQLRDAGLQPRVRVVKAARDHGLVIDQVPSAGTRVSRGATVGLGVASVETPVPTPQPDPSPQEPPRPPDKAPTDPAPFLPRMPDLVGRTFEAGGGDAWVQQLRLQLVPEDDRLADGKPGLIVRQSIAAGQPVRPGSRVVVAVATGVIVPPLLRVPIDAARQQVTDLGLQARITDVKGGGDPGLVLEQVPSAGTRVSRGAAVGLRVAVAETTVVPNVVGRTRGEADGAIAASRLTTEFVEDAASDRSPGVVSTQQPQPGTTVNVGSSVRMAIAKGAVVPAVINRTFEAARDAIAAAGLLVDARSVRVSGTPSGRVPVADAAGGREGGAWHRHPCRRRGASPRQRHAHRATSGHRCRA